MHAEPNARAAPEAESTGIGRSRQESNCAPSRTPGPPPKPSRQESAGVDRNRIVRRAGLPPPCRRPRLPSIRLRGNSSRNSTPADSRRLPSIRPQGNSSRKLDSCRFPPIPVDSAPRLAPPDHFPSSREAAPRRAGHAAARDERKIFVRNIRPNQRSTPSRKNMNTAEAQ